MPQAVAAWAASAWSGATVGAFAGATAAGTVTAVSVGLGTALVYAGAYVVAAAAIGVGISTLAGAVVGKPSLSLGGGSLNSASPLQMARGAAPTRRIIYGETRVSGALLDAFVSGTGNEFLHLIISLAGHECEAIGDVYFNDEATALDGSGNATGALAGVARIKKQLGVTGQSADTDFVADSGGQRASSDKFDKIAYLYARLKWDQSKYPVGMPNLSAVVKGRKVYDPRTSTTVWSDNPALCIRDYLTNTEFGLAVDSSEIDDASFIAAANICDEAVTLAAGGDEKRYTCNGSFETSAEPATVLEKLVEAMAGAVVYVGGQWICYAGAHQTPESSHLTETDLRAPISVQTKLSLRDTCNRVRGTFSSPDEKWQVADFTPIVNSTYLSEDGGVEIWRDRNFAFVTSQSQAQRLAKIDLERTRQDITATLPCKLTALRYKPGDVIPLDNTELGWSGKLFVVTALKFSTYDAAGELALGVDITVRETAAAVWEWNDGEETTYDPAANTSLIVPTTIATPGTPTLTTSNFQQDDGTITPRLKVAWTAPNDQFILSGGHTEIEYKQSADSTWLVWTASLRGDAVEDYITDVLAGVSYDVRLRWKNYFDVPGLYSTTATATVSNDTTAPATPTGLATQIGTGKVVTLTWDPNGESDLKDYGVYRDGSLIGWVMGTRFVDAKVSYGTAYSYQVSARDRTDNESGQTGGVSATPIKIGTGDTDDGFVTTPKLAYGAVSEVSAVQEASQSGLTNGGWTQIAEIPVSAEEGQDVVLNAGFGYADEGAAFTTDFDVRILRNGTDSLISTGQSVRTGNTDLVFLGVVDPDLPSGGASTYTLEVRPIGGGGTATPTARDPFLSGVVLKDRLN